MTVVKLTFPPNVCHFSPLWCDVSDVNNVIMAQTWTNVVRLKAYSNEHFTADKFIGAIKFTLGKCLGGETE